MSKLTVSPYTNQSVAQASGMRVTFDVTPPAEGVVYQNVHMIYHVGGDDSFLVPDEAWADAFGTLTITTAAWFEEGKIDSSFKRGKGTELWGRLYGSEHTRAEPKEPRPIRRLANAAWTKGQRPVWTFFK